MVDTVSPEVRSRMMSGIRSKNTEPEMIVRRGMHRLGFRFRLHEKRLPGKPDLVFPRYKSVIFVHGCFWHGHECSMFKWPKSRAQFWRTKIEGNKLRDQRAVQMLEQLSWRYLIVWECEVKNKSTTEVESRLNECSNWLIQGIKENETIKL